MQYIIKNIVLFCAMAIFNRQLHAQAPANDNCTNAATIIIANNGFGLGNFTSSQVNITNATIQTGENFAPAIFVAGLDDKSVWFKFSLPTIRAVRVTLSQPGTSIAAGDVGFAVYKDNTCLPTNDSISTKLTPIVTWGNTYHPCVPAGDYLVQVSSNTNANGPITIAVEISDQTGAAYDHPVDAYAFGVANVHGRRIDFDTECQSIEDETEVCTVLNNYLQYHKSAWFTFTTPAYLDYLVVSLSGTGNSTYFTGSGPNIFKKFGYNLYRGDAVTTPINGLALVDGCDSMLTNGYRCATQQYGCGSLQPNTTYSIQIFIHKDFSDRLRVGILTGGANPTAGPLPVNTLPASNTIGVLPSSGNGISTTVYDNFGCNSRHSVNPCSPSKPAAGVVINNTNYNLSSFFSFRLSRTAAINFRPSMVNCGPRPTIRLFKQTLTGDCTNLDTANIVGTALYNQTIECLAPGDYVMQVLGIDTISNDLTNLYANEITNDERCLFTNLGSRFGVQMTVYNRQPASNFSLNASGKFDSINKVGNMQMPLLDGISYQSVRDTIGCQPTLRPWDTTCSPLNDKIIYRQFIIGDSGTVRFDDMIGDNNPPFRYKLYAGDANALASAQNIFSFPDKIAGLVPNTLCINGFTYCDNKSTCVVPGTYTFASMGSTPTVGWVDRPTFTFKKTRTQYNSLANALDMGSILDTLGNNGGTIRTKRDYWSCEDNAIPINGYMPCTIAGRPATKAIYRQFYLKEDANIDFTPNEYGWWCVGQMHGQKTLFYGKATDGMAGLSPVGGQWNCFMRARTTDGCQPLPAGWYTVISWATGPSYDSTMRLTNAGGRYNGYVSMFDEIDITITPACPKPTFNRPFKASVATGNTPHLIQWGTTNISTPVYPRTDTVYTLPKENFNCTIDTPFSAHPIVACEAAANRVAYYVFRTTQESFLQIKTGGYFAAVYDKDVRTDSLLFATTTPIHPCNSSLGNIQFCHFQPGTYTLVIFAKDANICSSVTPSIFIDRVGYSRFDFAAKAYDFGNVPPDSVYHFGKVGDINPLHPTRPPSSDFIYCTTGAFATDPTNTACGVRINGNIYSTANNQPLFNDSFPQSSGNIARRNLWYTFVVDHPGTVRVKVENKTLGRALQPRFAVFSSDVDASLPFSAVQSGGLVDSTIANGLRFVTMNYINYWYCYHAPNNISFYRDPCSAIPTRYYVLLDNVNGIQWEQGGQLPNTQYDVSIQFDSFNLVMPKFDHYAQAGDIGTVGAGTFTGEQDNYSCATRRNDPLGSGQNGCSKTLWYKFTSTITGNVRYRIRVGNNVYRANDNIQLFKEVIPGDSTINGLKVQPFANVSTATGAWAQSCVSTGVYYLLLPGCNAVNEYVTPEIEMIEQEGDFCSRAVPAAINGAGSATASVLVNCHTIGTDYGEFSTSLTCPQNGVTAQYKTSWFRMDIGGTDTLDVTTFLVENTNAASSDIKYRMMTGNCGAMQEQSCVLDALTQNTYECLVPGQSYYVQVFIPIVKNNVAVTGTIDLRLSAVHHADTCQPLNNCLATANFLPSFDCTTDETVKFINYSTYGSNITYQWNFGHNGATSTAVSPSYFYPPLPVDSTYTIKLIVRNTSCNKVDSSTRTFPVPARPYIDFGPDIIQCNSTAPVILRATSYSGATYLWQNNSTADTFRVAAIGNNNYRVRVTYNGCISTDTIRILISPLSPRPLRQIVLCTDSVLVDVRRGNNETYLWSTGATTRSIYMSRPGYYWVDISYFDCVYRDSFEVVTPGAANPLGNDTILCFSQNNYILDAALSGAVGYTWQDNSRADTFLVSAPGQYHVAVDFGNCIIRDTVNILGYPAPVAVSTDTSVCYGQTLLLPWGAIASATGSYADTLLSSGGCDSLIRTYNITVQAKPFIGNDTGICFSNRPFVIDAQTTGAIGYQWQNGSTADTFTVSTPGIYWVDVIFNTCASRDSIIINSGNAPQIFITDTSICNGASFTLPWGLSVHTAGTYIDTLRSLAGCDSVVSIINLTLNNSQLLSADTSIAVCSGQTVNLTTLYNTNGLTASWTFNGSAVANPAAVAAAGRYRLVVAGNSGCTDTAYTTVAFNPKPILSNDSTVVICQRNVLWLDTLYVNQPGTTFLWSRNNMPLSSTVVHTNGLYQLTATNLFGCSDTLLLTLDVKAKPVLGNDTAISRCSGTNANLTLLYNTTGLTTAWIFNNTTVAIPSTVNAAGNYTLIAVSNFGCADTAIATLTINNRPNLGSDNSLNICSGQTANLSALYNSTGLAATWTLNNVAVANPAAVGTGGIYQLIAANGFYCSDTALVTLTINPKPNLGADTTINICTGNSINLATLYNTGSNTNSWSQNNIPLADISNINTAGVYQLVTTAVTGCADTVLVTVVITAAPVLVINNPAPVCAPATIDLTNAANTAGSSAALTYTYWQNANATIAYSNAATATSGTYYIKGISSLGCFDIKPVIVVNYPVPVVKADDDKTICESGSTIINAIVTNITAPVSFQWQPVVAGGIDNPTASSTTVNPSATQQYVVTVTDGYGCNFTVSDTVLVKIQPPVPAFAGNDTIASTGIPHQLRASGGVSYLWQPASLLNNPAIANPLATITADSVLFIVKVTDREGCTGYDTVKVKTYNGITYYVPSAFSPNNDGRNDLFRPIPVGIVATERFIIFNRYGEVVYQASQLTKGWDGTHKGKAQPNGNYVWVLKGIARNGQVIEMKGNVVLVR
jgi:gliding motility-associated-like protein